MRSTLIRSLMLILTLILSSHLLADSVHREMRVYDVRYLCRPVASGGPTLPAAPELRAGFGIVARVNAAAGPTIVDDDSEFATSSKIDPDALCEIISSMIAEDSWSNSRNRLEMESSGNLLVVQTPDVLDQIDRFLGLLEARAGRRYVLEVALIPPEALEKAAPGSLRPGAAPWREGNVLESALEAAGKRGTLLSTLLSVGISKRLGPSSLSLRLADYDVNQTGVIPVVEPVVERCQEGTYLDALALPSPDGDRLRVDVRLGRAAIRADLPRRKLGYGDLDLVRKLQEEIGTSVLAREGKMMVLGLFSRPAAALEKSEKPESGAAPVSFAALLRIKRAPGVKAATVKKDDLPRVMDIGLLLAGLPDFTLVTPSRRSPAIQFGGADEERTGFMTEELLLDTFRRGYSQGDSRSPDFVTFYRTGGSLFASGSPSQARKIRGTLSNFARRYARLVQVDLWQGVVDEKDLKDVGTSGALLDPSWIEKIAKQPGLRARLVGLSGVSVSLASVNTREYVADLENVSGGTGYAIVEVGDPLVAQRGGGLCLGVACHLVPDTPWAQLRVRGEVARPPRFDRKSKAALNQNSQSGSDGKDGVKRESKRAGEWLELELPDEDLDRWEHMVTVPLGRPILLNGLPDPKRPGRMRMLIAVVHECKL